MAKLNLLKSPYFDDYSEDKKFYRILFRPSIPVQARELTQMQTMVQKQIERFGQHFFHEGDKVVDGQLYVENKVRYLKLTTTDDVTNFVGQEIIGNTSKAVALVITATNYEDEDNPSTLYVKYISSGEGTNTQEFSNGEILSVKGSDITYNVQIQSGDNAMGYSAIARVNRGVYFIYGNFVLVEEQVLLLGKYNNLPTCKVGFEVVESIVTPEKDATLYDNAIGSYNESAAGAHRYSIDCVLAKRGITADSTEDFVELVKVVNGEIQKIEVTNEESKVTEDVLARRTYDESGDYVVRQFKTDIREHRSNDRGTFSPNNTYIKGDIVKFDGKMYRCLVSETTTTPESSTDWEHTTHPIINNGVNNALGRVTGIDIRQTRTYSSKPEVKVSQGDSVATCEAYLDENGKLINIEVTYSDDTFTSDAITVTVNGDASVAAAITNVGNADNFAFTLNSGKAYVKGYEIEKVGSTVLSIPKARTTETVKNELVSYTNGNYVYVTDLNFIPMFRMDKVFNLYDRFIEYTSYPSGSMSSSATIVGTCKIRGIAREGSSNIYKLYLADVSMKKNPSTNVEYSFTRDVKCFGVGSSVQGYFYANICKDRNITKLSGTITTSGTTVNGTNTNFTDTAEIKVGDYILANGKFARVETIISQNSITVDRDLGITSAISAYRIETTRIDPQNFSAIYKLTNNVISTVNDFDFTVIYYLSTNSAENSYSYNNVTNETTITFVQPFTYGDFVSLPSQYILSNSNVGIIDSFTMNLTSGAVKFVVSGNIGGEFRVCATIRVHNTDESTTSIDRICQKKEIATDTYVINTPSATMTLPNYDVTEILSIYMSDGSSSSDPFTIDISSHFDFDDGQRDAYYASPKLTLKSTYDVPTSPIKIEYKYFNQTKSVGNIGFIVNSYRTSTDAKLYDEIPSYNGVSLRNCIDFRQRFNDSTAYPVMLKDDEEIEVSYSYYLPRKDRICLDSKGNFVDVQGIPSLNPQYPEVPSMAMNLYNITIYPYVFDVSSDVSLAIVDNKRYTMRDIGKLETRVKNLEDYTTLSLLEQQTTSMTITDSSGLDRFKQGFVVDNFKSTDVISPSDSDVNCSLDSDSGILRPAYITRNVSMSEYLKKENQNDYYTRDDKNYMAYGKVFSLPLDDVEPHTVLVSQPIATRTENINPFAVVRFLGSMSINPSSDDWYENSYIESGVIETEGNYEDVYNALNGSIQWDAWEQSWAGVINTVNATSTITSSSTSRTAIGNRIENGGSDYRYDTYTTISNLETDTTYGQDIGYSRTGLMTTVVARTDYEEIGDYLVSTSSIPYMRSRNLLIKAKGLKPNTIFYPFFDNVDISIWCTPATTIQYTPQTVTEFDTSSMSSDANNESARIIENTEKSYWAESTDKTCLDVGDIIVGSTSKTTAVVVGKSVDASDTINGKKYYLYVVNIKGNGFSESETFTGSISSAIGKVISVDGHSSTEQNKYHGDSLISNRNGDVQFIYWLPNADKLDLSEIMEKGVSGYIKFKCGDRVLCVNDNENNSNTVSNSRAEATYTATGVLNTRQKTINAVRNASIVTESVTDTKTVYKSWSERTTSTMTTTSQQYVYLDPLAQTFLVECDGGCFISKVDVYFATKDENIPVTMEIRTVNNGYPSGEVLAFGSCTLTPDKVNISDNVVTYLDENGDSVSMRGFDVPTTFEFESPVYVENGQQYAVVLKTDSVNYRVWIAQIGDTVPEQDYVVSDQPSLGVLFKSQNASTWSAEQNQDLMFTVYRANFKKGVRANITFKSNDLTTSYLAKNPFQTTENSNMVTVWHSNHGFNANDKVTFTTDDPNVIDRKNTLTGTISVSNGSTSVSGTETRFDEEILIGDAIYQLNGSDKTFIGIVASVESSTALTLASASTIDVTDGNVWTEISVNGIKPTDIFDKTFVVSNVHIDHYNIYVTSSTNSAINATSTGYAGGSYVKATENYKFDLIRPNITSQTFSDAGITYTLQDNTTPLMVNANNEFSAPMTIKSKENLVDDSVDSLIIHCSFITDNQALSPIIDSDRISSILVSNLVDADSTQKPISNYVTKEITLSETANYLRITFEGLVSSDYVTSSSKLNAEEKIKVYYKAYMKSSSDDVIDAIEWTELTPISPINSSTDYQDISYGTDDLDSFDTFRVKIAMMSSNTSNPPKIRNLRIVACL